MLDQREDLASPHPPHIMREFMPIMSEFGDLSKNELFRILVDHVCTFVETNQVPWTNKFDSKIKFPRAEVYLTAWDSMQRFRKQRCDDGNAKGLESQVHLLCVFDAIMGFYAKANGKYMWMCKSMGMSSFHDLLLEFYGEKRLRYIYLIRDPRDVAMSFVRT
jgi:hypothetical protein